MSGRLIVIEMSGNRFIAPASIIPLLPELRPLSWDYKNGQEYYHFSKNSEVVVRVVDASTIEPCKRIDQPAAPVAAPTLASQHAVIESAPAPVVEPVRDFVHEYRDPASEDA
jgi:hypothetical protein